MSQWTHVAGIVRIDDLPFIKYTDWQAHFGKQCLFSDNCWKDAREHPDEYLPMGSEGSLRSELWRNPDTHHMAAYTVMIFGDLRDYDTPQEIIKWFKQKVAEIPMVRQAVITVELEGVKPLTWNYAEDEYERDRKEG